MRETAFEKNNSVDKFSIFQNNLLKIKFYVICKKKTPAVTSKCTQILPRYGVFAPNASLVCGRKRTQSPHVKTRSRIAMKVEHSCHWPLKFSQ
jgi:hypothetical protein